MTQTTIWPIVDGVPNQPDDRLRAFTFNKPPAHNLDALNTALSLATSCLTTCSTLEEYSGSSKSHNRQYAKEVVENITYLRLANFGASTLTTPTTKDDCIRYFLKRAETEMQHAAEKWGSSCTGVFYARNDIKKCKEALDADR